VIIAAGTREGGYTLYVKDRRLMYERNIAGISRDIIASSELLPTGRMELSYEFVRDAIKAQRSGIGRLYIDGRLVGEQKLTQETFSSGSDNVDIGQNSPSPVSQAYQAPFKFTGTILKVRAVLE